MRKGILALLAICFLSSVAWGMYGEDTVPSEKDSEYMIDREDTSFVTMPERETEMPEAMQNIRDEQKENPEEDYIEDNVTEQMRRSLSHETPEGTESE